MKLAIASGNWPRDMFPDDLSKRVCGACPKPGRDKPVYFRSTGLDGIAMAFGIWKLSRTGCSTDQLLLIKRGP
jgi:hypothetical protein